MLKSWLVGLMGVVTGYILTSLARTAVEVLSKSKKNISLFLKLSYPFIMIGGWLFFLVQIRATDDGITEYPNLAFLAGLLLGSMLYWPLQLEEWFEK